MSHTFSDAPRTNSFARELVEPFVSEAMHWLSTAQRQALQARTRKALRSLSDGQLKDAGIDPSLVHTYPEVEVDARLMSALMSMR
jgi:uncharacterized protein YjiS (DUF1127 family)